jgi:hypothetical protein
MLSQKDLSAGGTACVKCFIGLKSNAIACRRSAAVQKRNVSKPQNVANAIAKVKYDGDVAQVYLRSLRKRNHRGNRAQQYWIRGYKKAGSLSHMDWFLSALWFDSHFHSVSRRISWTTAFLRRYKLELKTSESRKSKPTRRRVEFV